MTLRGSFRVDEVPGARWDVALDLIRSGEKLVVVEGDIALGFQRHVGWPGADGKIHVGAYSETDPSRLTAALLEREGRAAVRLLAEIVERDPMLSALMSECGCELEYVHDYGMGAVQLGTMDRDGRIELG